MFIAQYRRDLFKKSDLDWFLAYASKSAPIRPCAWNLGAVIPNAATTTLTTHPAHVMCGGGREAMPALPRLGDGFQDELAVFRNCLEDLRSRQRQPCRRSCVAAVFADMQNRSSIFSLSAGRAVAECSEVIAAKNNILLVNAKFGSLACLSSTAQWPRPVGLPRRAGVYSQAVLLHGGDCRVGHVLQAAAGVDTANGGYRTRHVVLMVHGMPVPQS
jgi:hypothetical protein